MKGLLDRADKRADREWNSLERQFENKRARGEELYQNIDSMFGLALSHSVTYEFWINEKVNGEFCINNAKEDNDKIKFDTAKIKYLIHTYFSEIEDEFTTTCNIRTQLYDIVGNFSVLGSGTAGGRPDANQINNFRMKKAELQNARLSLLRRVADISIRRA